jgi:hypothetical protein
MTLLPCPTLRASQKGRRPGWFSPLLDLPIVRPWIIQETRLSDLTVTGPSHTGFGAGYGLVMNFRIEDEPKLAWLPLEGNAVDGGYRVSRNRWDLRVTPDGQLR